MTKKDYILISRALRRALPTNPFTEPVTAGAQYDACVTALADALAVDNPRFDRARFLDACGTPACEPA